MIECTWDVDSVSEAGGFIAALDAVHRQGWNGPAASALLEYARSRVVEPLVNQRRLFGEPRERAVTAGWLAAWEALRSPAIRAANSPWGSVRLAVTRGIKGDFIAGRYGMSARQAWRRYAAGLEPDPPATVMVISLDQELASGRDVAEPHRPEGLGERLGLIRDALVDVGWRRDLAEDALVWCAANYSGSSLGRRTGAQSLSHARTAADELVRADEVVGHSDAHSDLRCPGCDARLAAGWQGEGSAPFFRLRAGDSHSESCELGPSGRVRGFRLAAARMRIPEWQLRRVALLVGGGGQHAGLLELVVASGPSVLAQHLVQRCLRATVSRWAGCPSTMLAELDGAVRPVRAAA